METTKINKYLENAKSGKNNWWRYVLTLLSIFIGLIVGSKLIKIIKPSLKLLFPDGDLGKQLGIFVIIGSVFGFALMVFLIAFKKIHQRPFSSLFGINKKFNFSLYIKGFVIWGTLYFLVNLAMDYSSFINFINHFSLYNFILLAVVGFVSIGIQSFFEELLIRAYVLQGVSLKVKNVTKLIIINGLIFGLLHLGYGLESFLATFIFGVFFAIILLKQKQIEFVAGAHNAHNLMLSLIFIDLSDTINEKFSWTVDWGFMFLETLGLILLTVIVYRFMKTKSK